MEPLILQTASEDAGKRLDAWLAEQTELTRSAVQKLMEEGRVTAAGKLRCPVLAVVKPYPVLADGSHFLLQHQLHERLFIHARPAPFLEHLKRRSPFKVPYPVGAA